MAARSSITYHSKGRRKHRPIIVIGGDKGGVGKSFIARIIAASLRLHGNIVIGVDGDLRNGHLHRYYSGSMSVIRTSLRDEAGWNNLLDAWDGAPEDAAILTDLPGNIGDAIEREMYRIQLIAEALDREIIHIWVCNEEIDSVTLLARVRNLTDVTNTLVILNGRFGTPQEFIVWAESDLRAELLADGAQEAWIPVLPIRSRTKIALACCPFDDIAYAGFSRAEMVDFRMWWRRIESALEPFNKIMEIWS